ncbi:beta-propeller domain-containing protein [Sporosarcina limicola]|uniref:Secreted protein with C-terminal beta-propeller domain n=1 Tax=Sporosarcina limicola TaxID=34101 RepID=A0A927R7A2_9BACL|nr:beta-propeller domain-containing protein [Sporosarcina limicola]MBE1555779.1 putative secreted protein with C-terminal beta-propeller domain [Sporosarcina limicola]
MRKSFTWLVTATLILVGAMSFALVLNKTTVTAVDIGITDQGWKANLSTALKKDAARSGDLYVTDQSGKRTTADITLGNKGKTVHVKGLKPGAYTLHVKKNAVDGNLLKTSPSKEIKFKVREKVGSVASAKELKAYFERAKVMQGTNRSKVFMTDVMNNESESTEGAAKSESSNHSTTNNQVEGVDEADLVKTDGNYIYTTLGNGKITVTDIQKPKQMRKVSEIKMEEGFHPSQVFLHGKTLVVVGEKYEPFQPGKITETSMRTMPLNGMTMARLYDVSKPEKPSLIREIGAEGYMNGARKTGDILYFVTNLQPNFWIMNEIDGDILRPRMYDSQKNSATELIDYKDISILPGAMEPTYSIITAIDLSSPAEKKVVTKGYLGSSEQLYMSKDNLYITSTIYEKQAQDSKVNDTIFWNPGIANSKLFKFTMKGTDVKFQGSTTLNGTVLNQFSMDEHKGNFRVVTTEGNLWDEKKPSKNHLFILDEKMNVVGSVKGLAKGERIYSARFMGDKAYMVTFRETDPLFVIDVAEPAAPKVLGELKIPGFSNYLHPLDENHLIGFGYETVAQKNPQGGEPIITTQGMKVSLFDVTDFANPKEKDTEIIGGKGTYSQIQQNHKALFQHKGRNLFGFPVIIYDEVAKNGNIEIQSSGALIYEITPKNGIVLKGNLLKKKGKGEQYEEWETGIQRLLYSKNELYTVSMKEIKNYSLDSFKPIGSLVID